MSPVSRINLLIDFNFLKNKRKGTTIKGRSILRVRV
jgi:hypothetical protein